jgi:hypothetical protein
MALLTTRSHKLHAGEVQSVSSPPGGVEAGYSVNGSSVMMDVQTRLHVLPCDCDFDLEFNPHSTINTYSSAARREVQLDYCNGLQTRSPCYLQVVKKSKPMRLADDLLVTAIDSSCEQATANIACCNRQSLDVTAGSQPTSEASSALTQLLVVE